MKQLLIYEQPLALNRLTHRHLRIKPVPTNYAFARGLNSVPLTTTEFAPAARNYPIVFTGDADKASMPAVLLGLLRDDNLFVEDDSQWAAQAYVPAFLRRYPFVVANQETTGEAAAAAFTVCVDMPVVTQSDDGIKLFEDSGENAPALKHALGFLAEYQRAAERTQAFMQQLRDSKLLVTKTVRVERAGTEPHTLNGFSIVDEEKLQKLGGKALEKLSRTGALGLIYAHLMSLSNVSLLSARFDTRSAALKH